MYRIGLERDYIASIQLIESFITLNAKARYDILLQKNPELIKRLPSQVVAGYLGISQETLSRLKAKNNFWLAVGVSFTNPFIGNHWRYFCSQ